MTLIEIMVVMVIMALVATAAGFAILPQLQKAKIKQTSSDAKAMASAVGAVSRRNTTTARRSRTC